MCVLCVLCVLYVVAFSYVLLLCIDVCSVSTCVCVCVCVCGCSGLPSPAGAEGRTAYVKEVCCALDLALGTQLHTYTCAGHTHACIMRTFIRTTHKH